MLIGPAWPSRASQKGHGPRTFPQLHGKGKDRPVCIHAQPFFAVLDALPHAFHQAREADGELANLFSSRSDQLKYTSLLVVPQLVLSTFPGQVHISVTWGGAAPGFFFD